MERGFKRTNDLVYFPVYIYLNFVTLLAVSVCCLLLKIERLQAIRTFLRQKFMREYGDPSVIFSQRFQQTAELTVNICFSRAKRCKQPESPKNRRILSQTARVRESPPDSGGSLPLAGYITALPCIPRYPAPLACCWHVSLAPTTSAPISSFLVRGRK